MTNDNENTISLDAHRFKALISAYGSDIGQWPADHRKWAEAYTRNNTEALNLISYEQGLDDALQDIKTNSSDAMLDPDALTRLQYKIVSEATRLPQQSDTSRQRAVMGASIQSLTACLLLCACMAAGMFSLPYLPLEAIAATESEESVALLEINPLSSWD